MATDVATLSDEDLREQLQQYGVNVGPIVSSTRLFYEKKLGKLIDQGGVVQPETEESEEDMELEEEEDDEVQINYRPETRAKPQYTSTPVMESSRPSHYTPVTQARTATPTMPATRRNVAGRVADYEASTMSPVTSGASRAGGQAGGVAMWLKLILLIIVVIITYLTIINMNQNAENKIPLTMDEQDG